MTNPNSYERWRTEVDRVIERATQILIEAAHPEKIILFGSYARGDFDRRSDLDLLVIVPTVESRFDESVRLRHALRDIPMAIDLIVYSSERVKERRHLRGTMLYHALTEGRVLYDAEWSCPRSGLRMTDQDSSPPNLPSTLRRLKVDLPELEVAFEESNPEARHNLDLETGEVVMVTDEMSHELDRIIRGMEDPEGPIEDALHDRSMSDWWRDALLRADLVDRDFGTRFISVPTVESHDAYDDMLEFTWTVEDARAREALQDALNRSRPFRRFKDALVDFPDLRERWIAFSANAIRRRVLDWLADEGIEPIEE